MPTLLTLVHTDVVDSTALNSQLGDAAMTALWDEHDRGSRELLRRWRGREVDRSDGFMVLFESTDDAAGFALDYQRMMARLSTPMKARAGMHVGPLDLRENTADDIALGAKPLEVLGIATAVSARLMALAQGGQILLSPEAANALTPDACGRRSHGHWRMKGMREPMEVFEIGDARASFVPPPDSEKSHRVMLIDGCWVGAGQVPHSLPAEPEGWVGRDDDLRSLAQQLDGAHLVTLFGIGGVGKTRLALRYAWAWRGHYPGGVWFCDLAQARSLDGVLQAVASGLDVPLGMDPAVQLGRAIAGRGRCLLILDNFEQVSRHARDSVGRWRDAAPAANFLVTSRELLGLPGECAFELPPLPSSDAVALFQSRARSASRTFDPAAEDLARLTALVDLLDGLPLAIELAASRIRTMTLADMQTRMADRFRLLAVSRGGRVERHATLWATLQWSWELLTAAERSALAQLAAFEGGFDLASAEAVVCLGTEAAQTWLPDLLQGLVDKSLIRLDAAGRFTLLRSVQQFALHQTPGAGGFARGAQSPVEVWQRHWRFFAGLSEPAAVRSRCVELGNLMLACTRAAAHRDAASAATCLGLAWACLRLTGPFRAAVELADEVQRLHTLDGATLALVLWVRSSAQLAMGRHAEACAGLEQALHALGSREPSLIDARIHCALAEAHAALGDDAAANAALDTAQAWAESVLHAPTLCWVLNNRGLIADRQGQNETARRHFEQALALAMEAQDGRWQGGLWGNLGALHFRAGHLEQARSAYETALSLTDQVGDRRWSSNSRCNLGMVLLESGLVSEASHQLESALQSARAMGYRQLELTVLCNLGLALQRRGELKSACQRLEEAVLGAEALSNARLEAEFRPHLVAALLQAHEPDAARRCLQRGIERWAPPASQAQRCELFCLLAELEIDAGAFAVADEALQAARAYSESTSAAGNPVLEQRIQRAQAALAAARSGQA